MNRVVFALLISIALLSSCSVPNNSNIESNIITKDNDKEKENVQEKIDNEIDRTEYLTGEIITDGNYNYPTGGIGILYFVPDEESRKIIEEKFDISDESILLMYDDVSITSNMPSELGIYKVRVKIEKDNVYNYILLNDIQLTDKIGTVSYEGKTYETNELDENVKVKDKVCGLIVKWINRFEDGIIIRFAGEIETEGYYFINYNEMYNGNIGSIYFDEQYYKNIPMYKQKGQNNFAFSKTNELFDELEEFSSFGRGRFRNTNYQLVYNIGMGRDPAEYLTEIISLDEDYRDMFELEKNKYVGIAGMTEDFVIISSAYYDENYNFINEDYYYINKNKPKKIFLFSSDKCYNYKLKETSNYDEFILSSDGFNHMTGEQNEAHNIIFKVTEDGQIINKGQSQGDV